MRTSVPLVESARVTACRTVLFLLGLALTVPLIARGDATARHAPADLQTVDTTKGALVLKATLPGVIKVDPATKPQRGEFLVKLEGIPPNTPCSTIEISDAGTQDPPRVSIQFHAREIDSDRTPRACLVSVQVADLPYGVAENRFVTFTWNGRSFTESYLLSDPAVKNPGG